MSVVGLTEIIRLASARGIPGAGSAVVNETTLTVIAERLHHAGPGAIGAEAIARARHGLQDGEGIWIQPCRGVQTSAGGAPIDAVFLDDRLTVVALHEEVRPGCPTGEIEGADSLLELPVGAIRRTGLEVGHRLGMVAAPDADAAPPSRTPGLPREDH